METICEQGEHVWRVENYNFRDVLREKEKKNRLKLLPLVSTGIAIASRALAVLDTLIVVEYRIFFNSYIF